ncbi:GNAT family N-acetyltransferase [Anaeromicropila herbilytica]|uniref:GNAT family N-acetyltransferase n=1 Tax=Anaeromicropila herbilytica TaxID=2785025 RepID=A0A7R7EQ47_9FIRM|nr:GNAT family N-acetyltransferase [Anaeromicropila herbilytica]BCN32690.1 GNAT family N-acetyltransferase [Anaeromicropila herbilytica]
MELKKTEIKYVEEALELALEEYKLEGNIVNQLPDIDFTNQLREFLVDLFEKKYGLVAIEDGKVIGYLVFEGPWDGFFGNCKGAFSPLGASAFSGKDRGKLSSRLLSAVTEMMVKEEGVTSFALSRYANDKEVGKSLVFNGFGIRCSDAIMKLSDRKNRDYYNPNVSFMELKSEEKKLILDLKFGLTKHMLGAPIYFPSYIGNYMEWFAKEEIRVFAACADDEIIGFMSIQDEAENFITESASMKNICGAFVKEEHRGDNVATDLLTFVCNVCESEGVKYLGVDCETLNPTALRFWGKHFQNYTYSYHRRIDERVIGYEEYLEREWRS